MYAGTLPMGSLFPLFDFIARFVNFFTAEDEKDEKGEDDDAFEDDLDKDGDEKLFGDDDDEDKDEDRDEKNKDKSRDKSAIVQKQKYRDLYKKTDVELQALKQQLAEKDKDKSDTPEKKKEADAKSFLRGLVTEVLKERESEEAHSQKELEDEMESVLDDNDDLTEKQVTDVMEELGVTPKQALVAIRREQRLTKKAKPDVPRSKRGTGDVDKQDDDKPKKRMTIDEAANEAKRRLKALGN